MTETEAKEIPLIPGLPLIGNFSEFRADRLDLLQRVQVECGDVGGFRIGPRTVVLLSSAELAHQVLIERHKEFEKSPTLRIYLKPAIGTGLLSADAELHKRQRKLMAPVFQHKRVAQFATLMADCAERFQAHWQDNTVIDVDAEMMRLTMWIVGQALFSTDLLGEAEDLGEAMTAAIEYGNSQMSALVHVPYHWPTPENERARAAIGRLDEFIYGLIATRRAQPEAGADLLGLLLAAQDEDDGSQMSDQQLRDELVTLFAAGHETTATALSWAWHLLSQNPAVEARFHAELKTALNGRVPTLDDLPNLPYTLQIFKEVLRLYPPAYIVVRTVINDMQLGGYDLPAGTVVMLSPYVMHHRADYFPNPEAFDPDRFTPENEQAQPEDAYLPFGMGPRVCIGNHFALLEGHLLLAALGQRACFEAVPDQDERKPGIQAVEPGPLITLRPKFGIKMRVRRPS